MEQESARERQREVRRGGRGIGHQHRPLQERRIDAVEVMRAVPGLDDDEGIGHDAGPGERPRRAGRGDDADAAGQLPEQRHRVLERRPGSDGEDRLPAQTSRQRRDGGRGGHALRVRGEVVEA